MKKDSSHGQVDGRLNQSINEPADHSSKKLTTNDPMIHESVIQAPIQPKNPKIKHPNNHNKTPAPPSTLTVIVQRDTHGPAMMSVVLPNDALRAQLPETSVVIGAGRDEIGAIGREGAVPDPSLVAM